MTTTLVGVARPVGYLCAAGVLAVGSLLLAGGGDPAPVPPAAAAPAGTAAAAPAAPPCAGTKDSLRPQGGLPSPGVLPAGSTMAKIAARGRLIAGVDQGKYLAGYRDPQTGELVGADIDIVHSIAAAILGDPNKVQFVVLDIADRAAALQRGQVDVVVDQFTVTCDRQRTVEFSSAYMTATQRLLVPVGSGVREAEDLRGQRVCTSLGSTTERVLRGLPLGLDVLSLRSLPDCMVEIEAGRVAAVSSDDVILAGLAAQDPQTEVVGRALDHSSYAVGMRPDAPDLVRFVNALLECSRNDGSLQASNQRWLGRTLDPVPVPPPARYRD
jgi:polar amino acid transport system substrate-binding protein